MEVVHYMSPHSFLFSSYSYRLFPLELIQHPAVSLLWGGDEVTNVGQAIRSPHWAKLLWLGGETLCLSRYPLSWPSPSFCYLSLLTQGTIPAWGPSTCLRACVAKSVPQAMETTDNQAVMQEGSLLSSTGANENPLRNKRSPGVHANQYLHNDSAVQICFH